MTRLPPTVFALLLVLVTASLSAVAVKVLAASPSRAMLSVPTALPPVKATPALLSGSVKGPLDDLPTPRSRADRAPIAAMIDNFAAARPQSGIGEASIVYEAPVEGGITRLMPIFLEHDATTLGPIRSARPYFLDWALPYHPLFVHDGGSPAAQRLARSSVGLVNVDSARARTSFHRIERSVPPHNLFTGTPAIRTLAGLRDRQMPGSLPRLTYGSGTTMPSHPAAKIITIRFASPGVVANPDYSVTYRFDPGQNAYVRSVGGTPSVDGLTGRQIRVSNVVVLVTSIAPIPNDPLGRISIRTTGRGTADVFQNGRRTVASWMKSSSGAPLRLTSTRGSSVRLNPGPTWFEVVSAGAVRVK